MNTLTAIWAGPATPQQDAPGSGQASAADARGGFTDLVNLFLTPPAEPATGFPLAGNSDGPDGSAEPQAASALPLRTPQEIAGALIRLMSARATPATNAFSDAPKSKSNDSKPDRKQRESTFIDGAALLPGSLPFQPLAQRGVAGGSGRLSVPAGMTLEAAKSASGSAAPLAFALKLTPHDSATADPDVTPAGGAKSSASHDRSSSEPQQESSDLQTAKATREMLLEAQQAADSAASSSSAITGFSTSTAMFSPNSAGITARSDGGQPAQQSPAPSAADALRSGADAAPGPPAKSTAAQEIAVRIARPESASVDVHLIQRAGQVHVSVRTPDPGLQTSLRQDLGTLVNSLERAGYRTEAMPHDALSSQSPMRTDSHSASHDRQESGGGWASGGRDGSGQPGADSGGQRRQDQSQREQQDWTGAMEDTK